MLRSNFSIAMLGTVLAVGLTSCSKDKKTVVVDVYQPPPPQVVQANQQVKLNESGLSDLKTVDFLDTIDMTGANPKSVSIVTDCYPEEGRRFLKLELKSVQRLQIFQILPDEMFAENLAEKPVNCSIKLDLFNDIGSNHIYNINQVTVTNLRASTVVIENGSGKPVELNEPIPVVERTDLSKHLIRSPYFGSERLEVQCENLKVESILTGQAHDLGALKWETDEQLETAAQQIPIQLCRLIVRNDKLRLGFSPLFKIYLPQRSLHINLRFEHKDECEMPGLNCQETYSALANSHTLHLVRWRISNVGPAARFVRIAKTRFPASIRTLFRDGRKSAAFTRNYQVLHFVPRTAKGVVPTEETRRYWQFRLEPGEYIGLDLQFHSSLSTQQQRGYAGLILKYLEPAEIREFSDRGEELGVVTLPQRVPQISFYEKGAIDLKHLGKISGLIQWL